MKMQNWYYLPTLNFVFISELTCSKCNFSLDKLVTIPDSKCILNRFICGCCCPLWFPSFSILRVIELLCGKKLYSDTEAQRTHWQQPANTVIAIRMEISCDKHWQQRLVSSGKQDRLSTTEYSQWFITNQGWRYVALLYILLCKSYCVHLRISFCLQKRRSDLIANWINNISLYWTFS